MKERLSNIELLRIIAIFLILIFHSNFLALGSPTNNLLQANPSFTFSQVFLESLAVICVDIFVLISGWFAIRPKVSSFCSFIFQLAFFFIGIFVLFVLFGLRSFSVNGILGSLLLLPQHNWFIRAYVCLYIIVPILNTFVENVEMHELRKTLIFFFIFQTIFSWLFDAASFFESGYSTMSFIGLYLLGRYVRIVSPKWCNFNKWIDFIIYMGISLILSVTAIFVISIDKSGAMSKIYSYVNPLVILSSLYLLLFFSKLSIKSKVINWIASSSFAAYLLHANPNIFSSYFVPTIRQIVEEHTGFSVLIFLFFFLVVVYIVAIFLDKIRQFVWNRLWRNIKHKGSSYIV